MGSVAALEIVRRLGTNGSFMGASASMPIANSIMLFNFIKLYLMTLICGLFFPHCSKFFPR